MTKEEYSQLGMQDGQTVSVFIKSYRILPTENERLSAEIAAQHDLAAAIAEGI
jgi:hypothetical protein